MYNSFIRPHFDYLDVLYNSSAEKLLKLIDQCHYQAALLCSGCHGSSDTNKVLRTLNWIPMTSRRQMHCHNFMYKVLMNKVPSYVKGITEGFKNTAVRRMTHAHTYLVPVKCSIRFRESPLPNAISLWNPLPNNIKKSTSLMVLKKELKKHYKLSNDITTSQLDLTRRQELYLNRARVDLLLKARLCAHHFSDATSPN